MENVDKKAEEVLNRLKEMNKDDIIFIRNEIVKMDSDLIKVYLAIGTIKSIGRNIIWLV